jgi:phospholipid transport system substrate-binding protein
LLKISRRPILGFGLFIPVVLTHALAADVTPAQSFIEQTGNRVVSILRQTTPTPVKIKALYAEVRQSVAIDHVGLAALGTYRTAMTPQQQKVYLALFHRAVFFRLAQAVSMVTDPGSIRFRVTHVRSHGPTQMVQTAIHQGNEPVVTVGWQVSTVAGMPHITDVLVQGISMLKTVRASYTSVITDDNGNIDGLIAALRRQVHQA